MTQGNQVISLADIYNKNVNFLLGSGASLPLFPTLALDLNRSNDEQWTLEELATHFEETDDSRKLPLFMHYYVECIEPAQKFSLAPNDVSEVITNYRTFLKTVLDMLQRRKELDRRCNIFTKNYDGCIPLVADEILREGEIDFVLNDGAKGFSKRFLQASNFSSFLCQTGVFDRH